MTANKKLKARVHARILKTGESYAAARRHVVGQLGAPNPGRIALSPLPSPVERPWDSLIRTTRDEARGLLSAALAKEPRLTRYGYGIPDERRKRWWAGRSGTGLTEIEQEFREAREDLATRVQEVAVCADFIKELARIKTINRRRSSYGLKHIVENWFQLRGGHGYAWNGSFMAAALGLGLEMRPGRHDSPHGWFNLSERSIRSFMKRTGARRIP